MTGFRFHVSNFRSWAHGLVCGFLLAAFCVLLAGCTSRGVTISTEPAGAEVSINHSVVGTAPVHVGFTHYGTYHIELRKDRYVTIARDEAIHPPAWGYDPLTFFADNVIPARVEDELYLHYVMQSEQPGGDRAELLQRAELARDGVATKPRTGEQVQVAYTSPSKGRPYTAQPVAGVPGAEGDASPAAAQPTAVPPELKELQPITAKPPEGLRLANELGIEMPPAKPLEIAPAPEAPSPPQPQRGHAPKNEELIYDKPATPAASK